MYSTDSCESIDLVTKYKKDYLKVIMKHLNILTQPARVTEQKMKEISGFANIVRKHFHFDFRIISNEMVYPCHKHVLTLRSEILRKELSPGIDKLNWSIYHPKVVLSLLRWFYTDKVDIGSDSRGLALLQAASRFKLTTLFEASERMLVMSVNEKSYRKFYNIAKVVGANDLVEKCLQFKHIPCDDLPTELLGNSEETVSGSSFNCRLRWIYIRMQDNREELLIDLIGIVEYIKSSDYYSLFQCRRRWPTHTYLLSSSSVIFRENILSNPRFIDLTWCSSSCARAVLRWIYTEKCDFNFDHVLSEMLYFSHKFQLSKLFELCEEAVIEAINMGSREMFQNVARIVGSKKIFQHYCYLFSTHWADLHFNSLPNLTMSCQISEPTIMNLTDDCLLEICGHISLTDLSSFKRTCKRFNELADQYFRIYGDKSMAINSLSFVQDMWCLKQFGQFMKILQIDFDISYDWSLYYVFSMVAKYCNKNLQDFRLNIATEVTDDALAHLREILKNVEHFQVAITTNSQTELLLSYCENLKSVTILGREMELNTLWCVNNCNIRSITIHKMKNDDVLEEISKHLVHLECLTFYCYSFSNASKQCHLGQLDHLKKLDIGLGNPNCESLLQNLAKKNVLEDLTFGFSNITEKIAHTLGEFTRLKILTLQFLDDYLSENILDILSKKLVNIEKLYIEGCFKMTCEEIVMIIENLLNLKELIVCECDEFRYINRNNYRKLTKHRRNLTIFLAEEEVYEATMKLIAGVLSNFVKVSMLT